LRGIEREAAMSESVAINESSHSKVITGNHCREATRLRSSLILVEYVTSLRFLRQYQPYFRYLDVIETEACFVQKATFSRAMSLKASAEYGPQTSAPGDF